MAFAVVRPAPEHRAGWERLYAAYARFYRAEQTAAMRERVWGWLLDPDHEVEGFLALDADRRAVGLAHFRAFARPLAAGTGGFLDDLFVDEAARGRGVAERLIAAVAAEGGRRGWSVVRWITAEDNRPARALYDRTAARTRWITYDLDVARPSPEGPGPAGVADGA